MELYHFTQGTAPLLVSIPHAGTHVPEDLLQRFTEPARAVPDTDWHVDRLYDFAGSLGASVLRATHSRYVIDLNRPPDDSILYQNWPSTGLCPTLLLDGRPIYRDGAVPDAAEIAQRRATFWQPYHDVLAAELKRLRQQHGYALLYDAHSIRLELPRLFAGVLPELNLGTGGGPSADPMLTMRIVQVCEDARAYRTAINGRFIGGYITRFYGRPAEDVHAVQMELAQRTYMDEDADPRTAYDEARAARLIPVLRQVLDRMLRWAAKHYAE